MEYSVQKLSKSKVEVAINIAKEEWENYIKEAYIKNKHNYVIEGFRKGKVPMNLLLNRYGKEYFYEDALDIALDKSYEEVLNKENFEVVARPEVDIKELSDDGVKVVITMIVKPEFELGQYKGLTVKKEEIVVTDEEIDAVINKELNDRARLIEKETIAENGDTVMIDYSGRIGETKFEGGTAKNQPLELGSGTFIPGFEEQVVGMAKGETKDITVTFPENYGSTDLAGKEAIFEITVNSIQAKEVPQLDDEFVKDIDDELNTVEEWKEKIRTNIQIQKETNAEYKVENDLVDAIVNNTEIEIPDCMIEEELDYRIQEMEQQMAQYGIKFEDYLKYTGETVENIKESKKEEAVRNIKVRLVLEEICKKENITVSADEIKDKLADIKDEQQLRQATNYYANQIVTDKLFAFLKENNDIQ